MGGGAPGGTAAAAAAVPSLLLLLQYLRFSCPLDPALPLPLLVCVGGVPASVIAGYHRTFVGLPSHQHRLAHLNVLQGFAALH